MKRHALVLFAAFALAACGEGPTQADSDRSSPLFLISDAVHAGGNQHFFWLPPMVGNPVSFNGAFDGTLEPVVKICQLSGGVCTSTLETFTTTTGLGSEIVRVNSLDENYIVNWHTDESAVALAPTTYRISVLLAGTELGFADVQFGATGKDVKNLATEEIIALKDGRTLPIKFRIECVVAPSGLVSWWPGDGDAKDIADLNDGTPVNGATFATGFVTSGNGQAFSLDGANDYVDVPDAANLDISTQITIDAWINPTTFVGGATGTARLVDKITGGRNDGYLLDILGGKLRLIASGSATGATSIPLNTWTHVAATYDGAQIKLYINGVIDGTATVTGTIPTNNLTLRIGEAHPAGTFEVRFNGLIDEVEIFNRALSGSEIADIFNAGILGKCK